MLPIQWVSILTVTCSLAELLVSRGKKKPTKWHIPSIYQVFVHFLLKFLISAAWKYRHILDMWPSEKSPKGTLNLGWACIIFFLSQHAFPGGVAVSEVFSEGYGPQVQMLQSTCSVRCPSRCCLLSPARPLYAGYLPHCQWTHCTVASNRAIFQHKCHIIIFLNEALGFTTGNLLLCSSPLRLYFIKNSSVSTLPPIFLFRKVVNFSPVTWG